MSEYLQKNSELLTYELKLAGEGFSFIAGVDEVGRGPLAGPVVAAAVVITDLGKVPQVFDSKGLTEKKREELDLELRNSPYIKFAISEVSPEVIDEINILQATHLAMRNAVKILEKELGEIDFVLIDGRPVKSMPYNNLAIVKGDQKSASIAAASIIAKVYRDKLMCEYDSIYPEYAFAEHKGYGTKQHIEVIKEKGPCELHRRSFIKNFWAD